MKSQSLFEQDKGRTTAEADWDVQMKGRRRKAARVLLPVFLVAVGVGIGVWRHTVAVEKREIEAQKKEQIQVQEAEKEKTPDGYGYEAASMSLQLICDNLEAEEIAWIRKLLIEASDNKPSEIHVTFRPRAQFGMMDPVKWLNGTILRIELQDYPQHGKCNEQLVKFSETKYTEESLKSLLNQKYAELHPGRVPVFAGEDVKVAVVAPPVNPQKTAEPEELSEVRLLPLKMER